MLLRFCIIEKKSINLQRCVLPDMRLRSVGTAEFGSGAVNYI